MSTRASHLRILASATLLLTACGEPLGPGPEPITELPRALTPQEEAVIGDANAFGLALASQMAGRDPRPNIVLSPLSASMALGMTMNGAAGTTFDAMRAALGFGELSQEEINDAYRGLIDLLTSLDPDVQVDIANAVWANQDFPFHDAFFDAVSAAFDARATSTDFSDPATLDSINAWAEENTHGLIERILDELDPDLKMMLLNAIVFDGSWTTQFDPADTRRQPFTREDGSAVEVDMMSMDGVTLPLGGGSGYTAAELPYGGGAFAMLIVLPWDASGARTLLRNLDAQGWAGVISSLHEQEVDQLSIPKLTLTYDAYLNDALKAMGMEVAFDDRADFTRMSPLGDHLCIDFVRQKTFLEVDERGTRAAAVTAVGVGPDSFTGLIADHPFVFAIRERLSGTILFTGMVGDPTYEDPGAEPFQGECH